MAHAHHSHDYINYPKPVAQTPFRADDPPPNNPALRGTFLTIAAKAVELIPIIPSVIYRNTGWTKLKECQEAITADARYDPTVVPKWIEPKHKGRQPLLSAPGNYVSGTRKSTFYSVLDYHDAYKSGKTTPTQVVEALLQVIQGQNPKHKDQAISWIETNVELIRAAAERSTARWKAGKALGVLDGVPVGVKDEVELQGYRDRNFGTKMKAFLGEAGKETSWCCAKWEEEGAIIIGKNNMHEIGLDTSGCNPNHGTPINPYNSEYYSGGSSSGSASAVGSGVVPITLGCDGGGSIRLPSSWCGIYGLKTTHGWISTRPYYTPALSTSVPGPIAANMIDLEVAWRVMAQPDPHHNVSKDFPSTIKRRTPFPKRLGIYREWFDRADPQVKSLCDAAVKHFKDTLGYEIIDIAIPNLRISQLAHSLTILTESTVTFDKATTDELTPGNRILIALGRTASAQDFLFAQRIRSVLMEHLAWLFQKHPGLVMLNPTTPNAGWAKHPGDAACGMSDGNQSMRNMENVWMANFAGLPSLSMPVGYATPVKGEGRVPVGLMATGEWGSEDQLIQIGYDAEKYLHGVYPGGRLKPREFVDVFAL